MNMTPERFPRYLVLVVAAVLYGLAVVFVAWRMSTLSDGSELGLRAAGIEGTGAVAIGLDTPPQAPLQPDDRVIRVDGKPVSDSVDALFAPGASSPGWTNGEPIEYTVRRGSQTLDLSVKLSYYRPNTTWRDNLAALLFMIVLQGEALWLFASKPDERLAQLLFLAACATVTFSVCYLIGMDLAAFLKAQGLWLYYRVATYGMLGLVCSLVMHFALILPRLHDANRMDRRLVFFIYILPYPLWAISIAVLYRPNILEWLRQWEVGGLVVILICFAISLVVISTGYYRLRHTLERKRVGILAVAFGLTTLLMLALGWLPMWRTGQPLYGWGSVPLFALPLAVGVAVAVVFYRLLNIRVVIQRTLIWGTLTLMVIAVYMVVVGTLGYLFQSSSNPLFALVATGLAAVLFHPLRVRLQGAVTLLLFGERDAPYEVMARLTKQLEAALPPREALYTIVRTIGQALKASYVAIELSQDGRFVVTADYGRCERVPSDEWIEFPLSYGSELVGRLIVAPREPGDPLTAGDRRLISGVVHPAEVTIQTARLTADLQRSHTNLVVMREEERRRLSNDLHDGLGPALASLTLQIDAARNLLSRDTEKANSVLLELKSQVQAAYTEVRCLAREVRPPALAALAEKARQFGQSGELAVTLDIPDLPPLPAAVEGAAYRIVLEALTNASRHAGASTCIVRLMLHDHLCIEVRDNGRGLPANYRRGVGINSMMERAAELGGTCLVENGPAGGVRVTATLPLTVSLAMQDEEKRAQTTNRDL